MSDEGYLEVDLEGAEPPSFKPLPAGPYVFKIEKAEIRRTKADSPKAPNTPMLYLVLVEPNTNKRVFHNQLYVAGNENSRNYMLALMEAIYNKNCRQNGFKINTMELTSMHVGALVSIKKDNKGQDQNTVSRFMPVHEVPEGPDVDLDFGGYDPSLGSNSPASPEMPTSPPEVENFDF